MEERNYRPKPWTPKEVPTIWVDHTTGSGVTDAGTPVTPIIGRGRKNPNLGDLLDTAASYGAARLMLTGKRPEPLPGIRHWLYVQTPNWIPGAHWVNNGPPTGRFAHASTGFKIEVRTAEEWFGTTPLSAAQARNAWETLKYAIQQADKNAKLFNSPAATGTNLWALSLPRSINPVPVSDDIAEEIHSTSGQHHYDHLISGEDFQKHDDCVPLIDSAQRKKITEFAYIDGRFMYAGVGRELGIGPARRLNAEGAYELLQQDPYARARYRIRFRVPADWNHVGLFGVKHQRVEDGWYYPNKPGAVAETWADGAEVYIGLQYGWEIRPLEAIKFKTAAVLDTFTARLRRVRERVSASETMDPLVQDAVEAALRAIVLHSIGAFAAAGRDETRVAESALDVPAQFQKSMQRQGKLFIYRIPSSPNDRTRSFYHPELAAQVWGRARARVLLGPSALGSGTSGALRVDPQHLIGIQGDAVYATTLPSWAMPKEAGGGDDGQVGRLRLKGYLKGSFNTPVTLRQRAALRQRAERATLEAAFAAVHGND